MDYLYLLYGSTSITTYLAAVIGDRHNHTVLKKTADVRMKNNFHLLLIMYWTIKLVAISTRKLNIRKINILFYNSLNMRGAKIDIKYDLFNNNKLIFNF